MALIERRWIAVPLVLLAVGVGILGWSNYEVSGKQDKLVRRVDELSRANGIKDQQLQQAGIPPSPLLSPSTTMPRRTITTATTVRTTSTTVQSTTTTTAAASVPTAPPSTTTTTTRACPVTVGPVKVCP